jgi:hypothetical protein
MVHARLRQRRPRHALDERIIRVLLHESGAAGREIVRLVQERRSKSSMLNMHPLPKRWARVRKSSTWPSR